MTAKPDKALAQQPLITPTELVKAKQSAVVAGPAACAAMTVAALTLTNMDDGSADNTLVAIGDTSSVNQSGNIEVNFDKVGDEINALATDVAALKTAIDANNAAVDAVIAALKAADLMAAS